MNIVIFGPPGAGKGTQSSFIVKKFNLHQLSTGEILRNEIRNKTKLGKDLMRRRRNAMKRTSPSYPKNKKMMDGKSPHKKGTKKYKKHMAAIHAGESVTNEAEYQGKKVELNKPKRGGSKKYYVYVKNPKTDRVKKISFGDVTGLKTKANNKDRAKK